MLLAHLALEVPLDPEETPEQQDLQVLADHLVLPVSVERLVIPVRLALLEQVGLPGLAVPVANLAPLEVPVRLV